MLPGEPDLAPLPAIVVEAHIALIRKLHSSDEWVDEVSFQMKLKKYRLLLNMCTVLGKLMDCL